MQRDFLPRKKRTLKKKKEKILLLAISLFALFMVGYAFTGYAKNIVSDWLVRLAELEEGELIKTVPLQGIIMKEETVVSAPAAGQLELILPEGERVGVGGMIARVLGGFDSRFETRIDHQLAAPTAGIVVYELDGLEGMLDLNSYKDWEWDLVKITGEGRVQTSLYNRVEKGQPVAKIVNNLTPLGILVFFEAGDLPGPVRREEPFLFKLGDKSLELIQARLVEVIDNNGRIAAIFQISGFYEELLAFRLVELELVLERYRGLVVEEKAIIYQHNIPGLMVVGRDGAYQWQPVIIEGQLDAKMVISGLSQGTSYISNPR